MHTPESISKAKQTMSVKMSQLGYVHPRTGKRHTDEARQKMRDSHPDMTGSKNGMFGRKHKDSSRDAMSDKHTMLLLAGKKRPYGGNSKKGEFESTKTTRKHFYRSSWELSLMRWLDTSKDVSTWDYECVRIPYVYNDNKRWYVPDFMVTFVDGRRELWEVKPKEFVGNKKNVMKELAAKTWCTENDVSAHRVLTGDDLRAMCII